MKKITATSLLAFFSIISFSQGIEFSQSPKYVARKSTDGKAFEVNKKSITTTKYEYGLIANPKYILRINKIDSLEKRIEELKSGKNNNLLSGFNLPSKKGKAKEAEIRELSSQIKVLEKDIPPRRGGYSSGYTYAIPKEIHNYFPTGNINREVLVIDPVKNIANQLEGNIFNEEIRTENGGVRIYRLINQDTLHFKKNEIVIRDSIRKYFRNDYEKLSTEIGFLLKRESDNAIFCVDSNFENDLTDKNKYDFIKILNDLSIEIESSENHSRSVLVKNGKKCVLTEEVMDYLKDKKNADIIDKVNSSVTQYKSYLKQQTDVCLKIAKHVQAYKSRTMTKTRQVEWEKDTKSASAIQDKMKKLPFYDSIPFQLETEDSKISSANMDIIYASKMTLGL